MLKKLLVWVVLPALLIYFVIWWRVNAAVDEMFQQMSTVVPAQHGRASVGLNGDVGVSSLFIPGDADKERPSIRAGRIVVHTPGLGWVVKAGLFGIDEMPQRLGFSLEDIDIDFSTARGAPDDIVGKYSASLFETAGCGDTALTRLDLIAWGIAQPRADMRLLYELSPTNDVTVSITQDVEGTSRSQVDARFGLAGDPRRNPAAFASATLRRIDFTTTDQGFVAARNRHCIAQTKLAPDAFLDRHVAGAQAVMRAHGLAVDGDAWQAYRRFARDGGALTMSAVATTPLPLAAMAQGGGDPTAVLSTLAMRIGEVGGTPATMTLTPVPVVYLPGHEPKLSLDQRIEKRQRDARLAADRARRGETAPTAASDPTYPGASSGAKAAMPASASVAGTASSTASMTSPTTAPPTTSAPATAAPTDPTLAPAAPAGAPPLAVAAVKPPAKAGDYVELPYDQLAGQLGQPVRVTTRNGTTREGTLQRHSRFGIDVKLGARDGGIVLTIPASEVRGVSVVPVATAAPADAPTASTPTTTPAAAR